MPHYYDLHFNAAQLTKPEPHWIVRRFGKRFEERQLVLRSPGEVHVFNVSTVFQFIIVCILGVILLAVVMLSLWGLYNAAMGSYYRRAIHEQRLANAWMLDRVKESQGQLAMVERQLRSLASADGAANQGAGQDSLALLDSIAQARQSTTQSLGFAAEDQTTALATVSNLGRRVGLADEQFRDMSEQIQTLKTKLVKENKLRLGLEAERDSLNRQVASLQSNFDETARQLAASQSHAQGLGKQLEATESLINADQDAIRTEMASLTGLVRQLESTLDSKQAALVEAQARQKAAERQLGEAKQMVDEMQIQVARSFASEREPLANAIQAKEGAFKRAGLRARDYLPRETPELTYAALGGAMTLPAGASDFQTGQSLDQARVLLANAAPTMANLKQRAKALDSVFDRLPFRSPVADSRLTSGFGRRVHPVTKKKGTMHYGIDFADSKGTPILVSGQGKVVYAGPRGTFGNFVEIDHGYGFKSRYAHLQKVLVSVGDVVQPGQRIALMGNTGRSTGTHLHYEIKIGKDRHNPLTFIKAAKHVL